MSLLRGIECRTRAWVTPIAVLAIAALIAVPSAPAAGAPPTDAATAAPGAAKRTTKQRVTRNRAPRSVARRIQCAGTVVPGKATRRLNKLQRAQLRYFGAYRIPGRKGRKARKGHRAVKAIPARWICLRSKVQANATRRHTRKLGPTGSDRSVGSVTFPTTLDKQLTIALPGGDRAGWSMLGAPKVPAQLYAGGAVYSTSEYDVVQEVGMGRLKESIVVHRRQGVKTWRWKLLWKGGSAPFVAGDGTIRYGTKVVLDRPFLATRTGRHLKDLDWQLDGSTLSLTVDDSHVAAPYVIDPASSYPQFLYPSSRNADYVPGSSTINGMFSAPPGATDTGDLARDLDDGNNRDYYFWSNGTVNWPEPSLITNATQPNPQDNNPPTSNGTGYGAYGWAQEQLGGVTLPGGPWQIQARVRIDDAAPNNLTVQLKARLWKVTAWPSSTNFVQIAPPPNPDPVPLTDWVTGTAQTYNADNQIRDLLIPNITPNAGSLVLGVGQHVFIEYALHVVDDGANGADAALFTSDWNTFIDFGAAATNTPGNANNLRLSAPTTVQPTGWTNDNTPRLRADLDDPDWYHHIEYQICSDPACTTVVRSGTSAFGQLIGSTNDDWTSGTLADGGPYYMRARTVEDDSVVNGDDQIGAWTTITPTTCTATDVGPCSRFWVDTVLPTGAITTPSGTWNRGTVTISGTASDALSGVASATLQWTRTSPTAAGPSSAGIACAGTSPTWSCSWNTATAGNGTYTLTLTVVDNAGNVYTTTSSPFNVDNTVPNPTASVNDGTGADLTYVNSLTTLSANWPATTDPVPGSGLARYEYCIATATNCGGTVVKGWTSNGLATTQTSAGLALVEGGTYYTCVRAIDVAGNVSTVTCSNGQTVDTVPPTNPTTVNDGLAADIDWLTSTTTISANWSGGGDTPGSGLDRWEYCISTGTTCTGTVLAPWTSNGTTTNVTRALALTEGEIYYVCVRAFDNSGLQSIGSSCSDGQRVDSVKPPRPALVNDGTGADVDYQFSLTTVSGNWPASIDPPPGVGVASGTAVYEYCITNNSSGSNCGGGADVTWTATTAGATSFTHTGLSLTSGPSYYICVRAYDLATNMSSLSRCSDGFYIDANPPTWPIGSVVNDGAAADIDWTTSSNQLTSNWTPASDDTAIGTYEVCYSTLTGCAGTIVQNWTDVGGPVLTYTGTGLTLVEGQIYFTCVRPYDTGGSVGPVLCSDGQTVDSIPPVLPPAVNDGTGADIDWLLSTTTASANWPGGSDSGSGIASWEYCISTGVACSGTIAKNWTSTGTTASMTSGGLALVEGQLYYVSVRGRDVAGNVDPGSVSSDGQRVDSVAPPATPAVNDGTGADISYQATDTQISANWTGVADPVPGVGVESGLQRYQYCVSTDPAGGDCAGGATVTWTDASPLTSTSMTRTGLSLVNAQTYYTCVRSSDVATNTSGVTCSNGVVIDIGPPAASWTSWTVTDADPANPHLYSPGGNLLWYNPTTPAGQGGTATATVTATDPGAGMDHVDFPGLGAAGWGPGGTDSTVGPSNTWSWDYTLPGGGAIGDPALNNATAYDAGGASTGSPQLDFDIRPDSTGPVVGSMSPMGGTLQNTVTFSQPPIALGTDADSGVARWVMDVQFAPLQDNACGTWDPWIDGSTLPGYSGTAVNGTNLSFTHFLNDPNGDLVADYHDAFCFRTQIHVYDHVGNVSDIPANGFAKFDFGVPDVAITGPADGSAIGGTTNITGTTDDVWPGGGFEYVNTGSGIDHVSVTYQHQTLPAVNGTACASATLAGPWTGQTWTCAWDTTAPGQDGWYDVTVTAYDRAGNASTSVTYSYLVDNFAPNTAWHSWNDHGSAYMHSVGNVAWVNPNAPAGAYTLDARVTATDLGSGVASVDFPALGAGWSPGSTTAATFTDPVPVADAYTMSYTFANPAALAPPGMNSASAVDGAGNAAPIGFDVRLDGNAPTGVTSSVANGAQNSPSVSVTLGSGSDGALESGIGGWTLLYDMAPLSNGACGAYSGSWSVAATGVGIAPGTYAHDVTALGTGCYRYQLQSTDNVGNVGDSGAPTTEQQVDLIDPTVAITSPADGSFMSGTFNVAGDAVDNETGIDHVRLEWTGPAATSGVICDPASLAGTAPNYTFTCPWATGPADLNLPDGTYTVTATSYDLVGNVSATHSISVNLDNNPPFTGFHSFDTTGNQYAYWAGPVGTNNQLWYNPNAPAGTYSFDVLVTATDPAGVDRVEFDGAGAGWTPGAAVATQTVAVGPPDRYAQTYTFDTSGAIADPATLQATAFDPADNPGTVDYEFTPDLADPAGGTLSYANGYFGSTSLPVTIDTGDDGTGSGIRGWELLRADGTLSGGSCIGWGGYTTSVATGSGQYSGTQTDTVTDPGCFRYRLVVTDNVGRVGTFDGTDETKIDLTPPTGSVVLSEGVSGTQYQYLASPTSIYINTNAGASGDFNVDVTATAASGILDVDFPSLAAGFTGNGTVPGPGPSFPHVYNFNGPASAPPASSNVHIRSNSLGPLDLPFSVIADPNPPTGAAPTLASGFTTSTSVAVTWTGGNDGSGSGVATEQLERETGTLAGGACTWNNDWAPVAGATTPGTTTDSSLVTATCYRYRTAYTDNVANLGHTAPSAAIMVDTTAPIGASVVITPVTNAAHQWVSAPDTVWVAADPTAPASFKVTVTANDPESGTGTAVFPALGSTFVLNPGGPFDASYSWSATAVAPGAAPSVLVANGAGLTTTIPFNVYVDGTQPSGATIDQENGFVTDFMVDLAYAWGTDAESGIATRVVERTSAPYTIATDTCGAYGPWTAYPFPSGDPGGSPHVDNTVTQPNCYQYRIVETDMVGNTRITQDGDTAKVIFDITPPDPFDLNLPTNPALPAITTGAPATSCETIPAFTTSTPNFTWTPSADWESGLSHYDVYLDGVGAPDATIAAPGTSWASGALADGPHTIGVRALDFQANFTNAGPAFPADIRVDTAPPSGSLVAPAMGSWTIDTTPTLDWSASDTSCLARIEVDIDGSTVDVASGTEGSYTPTAPLANGPHTWSFTAWDSAGNSATFGPYTFGIDTNPPNAFSITAPTGGSTVRGFVNVTWGGTTDAESGLPATGAYQVLVDGIVRATTGSGTTNATVSGITNGLHTVVVRAFDAVGNYTDTAPVGFTGYPTIPTPVLVSPANGSYTNAVPTLTWSWPSDGGPAPTDFDVYVDGVNVGNETYPTMSHAIADPGDGTHSWKVEQHDPYTGTVTSSQWNFTLDRTLPINPGPLTRVATVVSWPAPTDPPAPVASGIDHQEFWIDDGTTQTFQTKAAIATSHNYGALPDGIYTMWVRAYDKAGNFTDSPSLVVTNDSVPPTPFNLTPPAALPALPPITHGSATAPTCETALTYTSATPTLQWSASSDATSGLAGYDVYIDSALVATVPAGTTSYVPAALSGGAHTWYVVARDNFGLSRTSTPATMNVRVDGAPPTIAFGPPADNSFTSDTTPTFSWAANDDNCVARVELTVGGNVYMLSGNASSFAPTTVLPEGPTTWSLRAFDSVGNVVATGATRTINVDTTPPSGITATFPANGSTVPEGMLTFAWSAGTDGTGSGVSKYDLIIDGSTVSTNLATNSDGTYPIMGPPNLGDPAVPHTWQVRVYDAVGNSQVFPFSFSASYVADTTPPDPFNLLAPATGSTIPAGTALTWEPAWDFKGVVQYRIYVDGALIGTTNGTTTTFTPAAGAGTPICTIDYDPGTSAGCIGGPTYAWGTGGNTTAQNQAVSPNFNVASFAGWSAGGAAIGVGDPTVTPVTSAAAGFDGPAAWTSVDYDATIPASGADLRFEHRYRSHVIGQNAYDGMTVELKVDDEGNGFADDVWGSTCEYNAKQIYGTTLDCMYPIVDLNGGYTAVLGGYGKAAQPLSGQHSFAGDSGGTVQTKMNMADFAGMNVKIRFKIGTDTCWVGMSAADKSYCDMLGAKNVEPALWRIDNLELANPSLAPGLHNWYVVARDAAGNSRQSTQTWSFNLT
ncbi:MAG: Ig-like domain repeat protein [Thermoleophilia bacterium]|nr:Ig-like domain repeat protein [Thermoleophilia bacterium]